jgi:hypothetical protein
MIIRRSAKTNKTISGAKLYRLGYTEINFKKSSKCSCFHYPEPKGLPRGIVKQLFKKKIFRQAHRN